MMRELAGPGCSLVDDERGKDIRMNRVRWTGVIFRLAGYLFLAVLLNGVHAVAADFQAVVEPARAGSVLEQAA